MKASNFILSAHGAAVIDLDAMREHVSDAVFQRSRQRDLNRFMRNWEDCPEVAAFFKEALFSNGALTKHAKGEKD